MRTLVAAAAALVLVLLHLLLPRQLRRPRLSANFVCRKNRLFG
jgi:hypothetical protein